MHKNILMVTMIFGLIGYGQVGAAPKVASPPDAGAQSKPASVQELATKPSGPAPKYRCDNPVYEFSDIWAGDKVEHSFTIHNDGDAPLEILNIKTGCGCTVPGKYDKIIQPSEKTDIPLTLNTSNRAKTANRVITIETNDPVKPKQTVTIKGTLKIRIELDPIAGANFGRVAEGVEVLPQKIKLTNNTQSPIKLEEVPTRQPLIFSATIEETEPGKSANITVTAKRPFNEGPNNASLRFRTGIKEQQELLVPCTLYAIPIVEVAPRYISIGSPPKRDDKRVVYVNYHGEGSMEIQSVTSSDPKIKTQIMEKTAGKSYYITTTIPAGFEAPRGQVTEITATTNLQEKPKLVIPIQMRYQRPEPDRPPTPAAAVVESQLLIGKPAPEATVSSADGKPVKAGAVKDKVTVLNFWATWSAECKNQLRVLKQVANLYKNRGVEFLNVCVDAIRPGPEVMKLTEQMEVRTPILLDPQHRAVLAYGTSRFPTLFLIGKNGVVEAVHIGDRAGLEADLRAQLDVLLEGKTQKDFATPITTMGKFGILAEPSAEPASSASSEPAIMIESRMQDTGSHKPGAVVKYDLYYRNEGGKELTITDVIPSKGMRIDPDYTKKLAPKESGAIRCEYTAPEKPGELIHRVIINSNDPKRPRMGIGLTGITKPYIEVDPPTGADFTDRVPTHAIPRIVSLYYNGEGTINYLSAKSTSPKFEATVEPLGDSSNAKVIIKSKPPFDAGENQGVIRIETDCKEQPVAEIPVRLMNPVRIAVTPPTVEITKNPQQQHQKSIMVAITNNGDNSLNILGVDTSNPEIRTQFYPEPDGVSYKLKLIFLPKFVCAAQGEKVTIRTDDKEFSKIEIPIQMSKSAGIH